MISILVIDDDKALCRTLEIQLHDNGHETNSAYDLAQGLKMVRSLKPDLILLDLHLPDQDGLEALPNFLEDSPNSVVAIVTGDPDNLIVSEAMRAGAYDYLRKPLDLDAVLSLVEKVNRVKQSEHLFDGAAISATAPSTTEIVGSHPKVVELHKSIGLLSRSRVTVLIEGESGTGKELAARILHDTSSPDKPFVPINCSAIVPTLLESELFGHEKGAFTGADKLKVGKMEYADGGTVFFDEIGDLPLGLQGKLLRVLQEEEFVRVGGLKPIPLNARIVAATHRNLKLLASEERFRKDLYYRLAVSRLELPPLRERREDIPVLVGYLLAKIGRKLNRHVVAVEKSAMDRLKRNNWPGNVREMENILIRTIAMSNSAVLADDDLKVALHVNADIEESPGDILTLAEAEKKHLKKILSLNKWNITQTAQQLSISPTTLRKKITDSNLQPSRREADK